MSVLRLGNFTIKTELVSQYLQTCPDISSLKELIEKIQDVSDKTFMDNHFGVISNYNQRLLEAIQPVPTGLKPTEIMTHPIVQKRTLARKNLTLLAHNTIHITSQAIMERLETLKTETQQALKPSNTSPLDPVDHHLATTYETVISSHEQSMMTGGMRMSGPVSSFVQTTKGILPTQKRELPESDQDLFTVLNHRTDHGSLVSKNIFKQTAQKNLGKSMYHIENTRTSGEQQF